MIDFVTEPEKTQDDLFEEYYAQTISPLVEKDTLIKKKYRGRFWATLWSICFLVGINSLVTIFLAITNDKSVNYEQLMFINVAAFVVICWPIISYYQQKKMDLFGTFLGFYGNWKHIDNVSIAAVHRPIIPTHETLEVSHKAHGSIGAVETDIRDTVYKKTLRIIGIELPRTVSKGVRISLKLPRTFAGTTLFFEKSGFYRKNKFPGYDNINDSIFIPAANYFLIFSSEKKERLPFLESSFFETLLDLKETFKAAKIYVEIKDNSVEMYLENAKLYFDTYTFWSSSANIEKFRRLHEKFEHLFAFTETIMILTETSGIK